MKHFRLALLAISVILTALLFTSCHFKKAPEKITSNPVKTDIVRRQSNEITISYPGKVKAMEDIDLSFRIAGPIAKVDVVPGQRVKKGDVIAQIDERDYKLQLAATEAEYTQIKAEAERVMELYARNSATMNDYDKAYYGLQQITAKYDAHKNALHDTKMTAPFDGYIQKVYFHANETVSAGLPVISMISGKEPQVEINIPSEDFIKREQFTNYYCTVDVYPGMLFPLKLVDVKKKANLNQLFTATFTILPYHEKVPYPGMSATVFIKYNYEKYNLVSVPINSIFEDQQRSFVWVVGSDNKVSKRNVKTLQIKKDGNVVLSEGLQEGEVIVTAGIHSLHEGDAVKVLPKDSPTNVGNLL